MHTCGTKLSNNNNARCRYHSVDVCVAVSTDKGLITPIVTSAEIKASVVHVCTYTGTSLNNPLGPIVHTCTVNICYDATGALFRITLQCAFL